VFDKKKGPEEKNREESWGLLVCLLMSGEGWLESDD